MTVDQPTLSAVTDQASNVADAAARSGRQVGDEAANQASEVVRQTKEQVRTVLDDTKQEIQTQAQQRGEQAATALHSFSDQLSSLAEGRPEEAGQLPNYVRDAEGRVRDLATRLQTRGPDGVVADLSDFARRRPGTFLLGAACAGFLIGRVVRAGNAQQQTAGRQTDGWSSASYTTAPPVMTEDGPTPGSPTPALTNGQSVPTGGIA